MLGPSRKSIPSKLVMKAHYPLQKVISHANCRIGMLSTVVCRTVTSCGTETEPYTGQHISAEVYEARHKSTVSRTRMDVSGKQVSISQGTSTMSVITLPDSNPAENTHHLLISPAFDVPNGDFDGPLQGRFKLVKRNLDQGHQQQLELHGWVVTSAGTGVQGSAEAHIRPWSGMANGDSMKEEGMQTLGSLAVSRSASICGSIWVPCIVGESRCGCPGSEGLAEVSVSGECNRRKRWQQLLPCARPLHCPT